MPLARRGLPPDGEGAHHDPCEERDHQRHAGKAELLRQHREQEIGMRFRQVVELLDARTEPDA